MLDDFLNFECFLFYTQVAAMFIYLNLAKLFEYYKSKFPHPDDDEDPFMLLFQSEEDFLASDNYISKLMILQLNNIAIVFLFKS